VTTRLPAVVMAALSHLTQRRGTAQVADSDKMQTDRAMRYVHGLHCLRSTTNRSCISQSRSGTFLLGSTTLRSLYLSIFSLCMTFSKENVVLRGHFVICICPCLAWIEVANVKQYLNAIKAKQSASNARKRAVVELERYS